jgi:hypothetical protein
MVLYWFSTITKFLELPDTANLIGLVYFTSKALHKLRELYSCHLHFAPTGE